MTNELRAAINARRGLHEDAQMQRKFGLSAAEWEERVADLAPDAARLVGDKGLDAIVRIVWMGRLG